MNLPVSVDLVTRYLHLRSRPLLRTATRSISCEVFFYAIFPCLIAFMRQLGKLGLGIVLVGGFATQWFIIWASRAYAPMGQRGFLVSQFPPTHLFEFVVGIVAALAYFRGASDWLSERSRRPGMLLATLIPLVAIAALRPVDPVYLLMSPLFGLLVLCLAIPPRLGKSLLARGSLVLLGEASFSLYMIHIPLLNLISIARPPIPIAWLAVASIVLLSILIFKYFETPARILLKNLLLPPKTKGKVGEASGKISGIGGG